jgi:putative transposase
MPRLYENKTKQNKTNHLIMAADKFQNKYHIPSARAVWHDYNGGDYFITICTGGRNHYFGGIVNGAMVLNVLGQKLNELILDIQTHNQYAEIPVYQVMPNHVHLIVCIDKTKMKRDDCGDATGMDCGADCRDAACHVSTTTNNKTNNPNKKMQEIADKCGLLSTAMGGMKSAFTKYANNNKIEFGWQTRFHDHIIRDREEWNHIATYIENNPKTWENDKFYTE